MPRQIIDTESSKPAYQRRLALRWVIAAVLVIIAIFIAFEAWKAAGHHAANLGRVSPAPARAVSVVHRSRDAA